MLTAQDKKDRGAFGEAVEKFNKKKDEVLNWLEEAKTEVEKKIHETIDPILQSIQDKIPAPIDDSVHRKEGRRYR